MHPGLHNVHGCIASGFRCWRQPGGGCAGRHRLHPVAVRRGQAFPVTGDFAVAKIADFAASVLSSLIGVTELWGAQARNRMQE
jgi:hypothetical protein